MYKKFKNAAGKTVIINATAITHLDEGDHGFLRVHFGQAFTLLSIKFSEVEKFISEIK